MKLLKRLLKNEAGQVLPMALVLLLLGGFLVVPMLSFMTTSLTANRIVDTKTLAIYAADAGIQDALWKLGNDPTLFADSYDLPENINGMTVTVEKVALVGDLYTLRATATNINGEVKAVITAQAVAGSDYSLLFDNAITSENDIFTSNHDIINGDVVCGGEFDGDPDQVYSGTITENATVEFPSPQELIDYYMSTIDPVANNYTSNSIYISSSYTKANPYMIPPIYRNGDLRIYGNGYGKLDGTIYLAGAETGQLWVDPGTTVDLNGHTIFSEYYNNCDEYAINFQPNCYIFGPGCIVAIGDINYQPNLGTGDQLVGVEDAPTEANTTLQDRFALYRFKATATDKLSSFQVKCYIADEAPEAHVKVAVYADASGAPGALLGAADYADNITVISSWNPIRFPPTQINSGTYYWLAAISDYPVISKETVSSTAISKYKSKTFSGFQFSTENPPTVLSSPNTEKYMFRGFSDSQEFIFIMSVECGVYLAPHASFYGSIAGDTTVDLGTWCTLNLVTFDEGDLDFPGISGASSGSGTGGNSPPMLNYNIQ